MGDIDLVRALGLAGISSVVAAPPGDPAFYSRHTRKELSWVDTEAGAEDRIDTLMRFGASQPEPPVLFYQSDWQLLLVSRYRERLAEIFRFVIADPDLVEDLVDKARFQELAQRLNLPVPAARRIRPSDDNTNEIDLRFPIIIKPVQDRSSWESIGAQHKALLIETKDAFKELWPRLTAVSLDLLIQEAIPGPESRIESYHVYIDQTGTTVAEFTGRKIRTLPVDCGHSTALEITDALDVRALGREIAQRLNLRGVAKLDFKRGPEGMLHLLEINPRFNLWHHLGAVAGVNLPALVYADLVGLPRSTNLVARAGTRWGKLLPDARAARASGVPITSWMSWALRCEAKSAMSWDDPMPFLREVMTRVPLLRRVLRKGSAQRRKSGSDMSAHGRWKPR
ncbi:carboxylate--amine ligase [Microvirga sp. 2TAF3]|uniref:carboxylate--amine ligase n=1 Tax=Microvirga sp. 2TAF3 TaxID=3233014 RepID=UPI003F96DB66